MTDAEYLERALIRIVQLRREIIEAEAKGYRTGLLRAKQMAEDLKPRAGSLSLSQGGKYEVLCRLIENIDKEVGDE
jgi:hypothetical protein